MIIDFHTHAFPDAIAPRAMGTLSYASGGLKPQTEGTVTSLKEQLHKDGVDMAVVLSIATNPAQQKKVNDFAMTVNEDPMFFAFGSVHPEAKDALEELERIRDAGLKGVKFHPEYQNFYADDEKMKPIYQKISQLGLITVFHAGHDLGFPPPFHAMPEHLLGALKWLEAPVVAAHWGGVQCDQQVLDKLCGKDIYFDLSFGYGLLPRMQAQKILEKHGTDRLLFGSDMPWHRPSWEQRLLDTLDLSHSDKEKIYHQNARKLLGL